MTEILTESFCERCGTRYTFESARPRTRLKGVKVLSRGLKNFVLSDETSMDEAMAAARSDTDREATAYQLDAFHKTFNFCMQCRQYTCPNCWNEAEARCLTCAPHLGHDVLPAPFPDLPAAGAFVAEPIAADAFDSANGNGWHTTNGTPQDGEAIDFAARLAALTGPVDSSPDPFTAEVPDWPIEAVADVPVVEPELVEELPVMAAPEVEATVAEPAVADVLVEQPILAAEVEAPVTEPADPAPAVETDEVDHEAAARLAALGAAAIVADAVTPESDPGRTIGDKITGQTTGLLKRFRPSQSLDAELDAYERAYAAPLAETTEPAVPAGAEVEVAAQPAVAAEPDIAAEPTVAAEPDVAAAPDIAAEPDIAAAASTAPVAEDIVSQPTWRMVAPDPTAETPPAAPLDQPGSPAAAKAEPQWPERPQWLGGGQSNGLPFLGRPATPQGGVEALWAQSNAEVVNPTGPTKPSSGIQPCVSCGLSLSATAKFCRRCGTPQAV